MHWNQFDKDPARACALGDILLAVALAGGPLDEDKLSIVYGQVAKAFGASTLPYEIVAHLQRFDTVSFDPEDACRRLELDGEDEHVGLLKAVALVIRADGSLSRAARLIGLRLASQLGISWSRTIGLLGPPLRPIARRRHHVVTHPY